MLVKSSSPPGAIDDGLQFWLKAETGIVRASSNAVAEWQDQSGYDHHVTPDRPIRPTPVRGEPYGPGAGIRFDGYDFLTSDLGMPTGDYTKIVHFTLTSDDPKFIHNLVSSAETGSSSSPQHALYLPQLRPTLFHRSDFASGGTPIALNQPLAIVASYNSANREGILYLDGEWVGSGTAIGDNTKDSLQVGAYIGAHFLHGSIAEVMVYDRVLNENERDAIEAYLAEKYRTPFELWQKQFLLGEAGAPDFDFDGDGLPNSMEYVLGLNPARSDSLSDRLPRINRNGPNIEVSYTRPLDRPDAMARLERSEDLHQWLQVEDQSIANDGTTETRFYSEDVTELSTALFFRLRVTVTIAP